MHFLKRNFKLLVDSIEQGFLFQTRREQTIESVRDKEPTYRKENLNHQTAYFGQCISRLTKSDPVVPSITNDDILSNNIHVVS